MEIVLGWISKHLDKPGFDEGIEICKQRLRLPNLAFNALKRLNLPNALFRRGKLEFNSLDLTQFD